MKDRRNVEENIKSGVENDCSPFFLTEGQNELSSNRFKRNKRIL